MNAYLLRPTERFDLVSGSHVRFVRSDYLIDERTWPSGLKFVQTTGKPTSWVHFLPSYQILVLNTGVWWRYLLNFEGSLKLSTSLGQDTGSITDTARLCHSFTRDDNKRGRTLKGSSFVHTCAYLWWTCILRLSTSCCV